MWRNVISLVTEGTPLTFHAPSHPIHPYCPACSCCPALPLHELCPMGCHRRRLHRAQPFRTKKILRVCWHTCSLTWDLHHTSSQLEKRRDLPVRQLVSFFWKYFLCSTWIINLWNSFTLDANRDQKNSQKYGSLGTVLWGAWVHPILAQEAPVLQFVLRGLSIWWGVGIMRGSFSLLPSIRGPGHHALCLG